MSNCPRPGKCIYDDFRRCGVHFCVRANCMYRDHEKRKDKNEEENIVWQKENMSSG